MPHNISDELSLPERYKFCLGDLLGNKLHKSEYDGICLRLRDDFKDAKSTNEVRVAEMKAIFEFCKDVVLSGNFRSRRAAALLVIKFFIECTTGVLYPFRFNPVLNAIVNTLKAVYYGPSIPLGNGKSINIGMKDLNPITAVRDAIEIIKSLFELIKFSFSKKLKSS